jgi:nucleoside-diphosphate-sugar epimerase
VRRLVEAGTSVRALVRSPARAGWLAASGVDVVAGEITDQAAVERAVEGATTVYHFAGRLFIPGVPQSLYRDTHVTGTQAVLASCRRSDRLERLVHCSTTGVIGVGGDEPRDETARFNPTNVYEATKAEAELAVHQAIQDGLPAAIVRPGLVYGPGDLHLLGFFRAVLRGQFRPIGRRPVWLHPIYIDDLVEGVVICGRHPAAVGEAFNLAGRKPATLLELATAISQAAGTRQPGGFIPLPAARAVAALGDLLPSRLRQAAPMTTSRLDFLTHSRVYDTTKAQHLLGFSASTDLATGVAKTLDWYRANGHLRADNKPLAALEAS